ncbi:Spy/CpxP family protein refolding chaperone [Cerasicoccus fimbriatus]|uniref:Spy/CpxP family protein refolding chaperone n=1 Tax=Cerasicoccus fimbriatus TaxID=3014554 RepID=UPI0022B47977|nr:hypothetical protein [Cerasicoccus sp. TK19100]
MSCDCNKKNKTVIIFGLIAGLVFLCVLVSSLTSNLLTHQTDWTKQYERDGHQWLHHELNLTPEELAAINTFEPDYRNERAKLQHQFQSKIEQLRQEIVSSDEFSNEARVIIHELHIIHGQLQELSIQHYYQMMSVLPPEKQSRLRDIAAKALSVPQ